MNREDILQRMRAFIEENFLYMRPDFKLADDASLMQKGVVDSMGVMEVIEFIEQEFGVAVADTDVTEKNMGTLAAIADYVAARSMQESRLTA